MMAMALHVGLGGEHAARMLEHGVAFLDLDVLLDAAEHADGAVLQRRHQLAVRGGQIDLVGLLSSEESVLRGRREYTDARLAFRQAWLQLEAAVGARVSEREAGR